MRLRTRYPWVGAYGADVTVLTVLPDVLGDMSEAAGLDLETHFDMDQLMGFPHRLPWKGRARICTRGSWKRPGRSARKIPTTRCSAPAEILVEPGDPAQRILEQSSGYDLIVMGTHGKSGFLGRLMGSVAEKVVRQSTVPVLVVRLPEPAEA